MSPVGNVQRIDISRLQHPQLTSDQVYSRMQLFTADTFEAPRTIKSDSGTIGLPVVDTQQRHDIAQIFHGMSEQQQGDLIELGNQLNQTLASVSAGQSAGSPQTQRAAGDSFEQYVMITGRSGLDQAMDHSMTLAIMGAEAEVYDFAKKLQANLDAKAKKREDIADLQNQITDWRESAETWPPPADETHKFFITDENGNEVEVSMTLGAAEDKLAEYERDMTTMSDMTQMMEFDLQTAMQQQQQAMEAFSNILKMTDRTQMAMINNMK